MPSRPTNAQNIFLTRLEGNRRTTARIPALGNAELSVTERLLGARSEGTWQNLSQVWKQFLVFCEMSFPVEGDEVTQEWKIMLFLETKLQAGIIKPPTAYTYMKNLRQCCTRLEIPLDRETLAEYGEALKRGGALVPQHQATPATRLNIEAALPLLTRNEEVGLMVAWKTASRIGELAHLVFESFTHIGEDLWAITFPYHKGDPSRG
jgi:hypothetical protein